jgi:hypothetical protein
MTFLATASGLMIDKVRSKAIITPKFKQQKTTYLQKINKIQDR